MNKLICVGAFIGLLAAPVAALADSTGQYGDVQVVNSGPASDPSVFQLTSNSAGPGYAGIYFSFSTPLAVSDIAQLSADYQMTVGPMAGGAPRFSLGDAGGHEAYVFFGTPTGGGGFSDANGGAWGNTGNYADLGSSALRVESNGFGGDNASNSFVSWADFVGQVGSVDVAYITLDLDAGTFVNTPAGQQMLVDNFTVNGAVLDAPGAGVPEPATWALMILGFGGIGAAVRARRKAPLAA
jgi:hypothetical protein